jgi:hypothetical protein
MRANTILAARRTRYVTAMVTTIAAEISTNAATSNSDCLTSEVMPRIVAIAPGPNMIGMARGTKATSSSFPT